MVISNYFPCKDLVHHLLIETTIKKRLFRVPGVPKSNFSGKGWSAFLQHQRFGVRGNLCRYRCLTCARSFRAGRLKQKRGWISMGFRWWADRQGRGGTFFSIKIPWGFPGRKTRLGKTDGTWPHLIWVQMIGVSKQVLWRVESTGIFDFSKLNQLIHGKLSAELVQILSNTNSPSKSIKELALKQSHSSVFFWSDFMSQ